IGTIDTSELLVVIDASAGFFLGLSGTGIDWTWAIALLVGGIVAAPIAAWLVRLVPPRILGSVVGGFIVLTNARTLLNSDGIQASAPASIATYAVIAVGWIAAVAWSARAHIVDSRLPAESREGMSQA